MCAPTRRDMRLIADLGERDHIVLTDGGLGILRMLHARFDDTRRGLVRERGGAATAAPAGSWREAVDAQLAWREQAQQDPATTLTAPVRDLDATEAALRVTGRPVAAALLDVGLFAHHTGRRLAAGGGTAALALPPARSEAEQRWWSDVIGCTEQWLRLPQGTLVQHVAEPAALASTA